MKDLKLKKEDQRVDIKDKLDKERDELMEKEK
jgi:hypothetical protein